MQARREDDIVCVYLGAIAPEVTVHAVVNGLAVRRKPSAPRIIPQAAPFRLLLEAHDFRDGLQGQAGGIREEEGFGS